MRNLVYLDTETTGLDPELHEIWELAYAINDDEVLTFPMAHSLRTADPMALSMNGYYQRGRLQGHWEDEMHIKSVLTNVTIVGANPGFDVEFLRKRWGTTPWHYRKIDVESMALMLFGYEETKGLADIAEDLRKLGHPIVDPNHSAGTDVMAVREVFKALRLERQRLMYK